jgi:tetrahydromethanopterin S-methyltransferase subunit E
MTNHASHTKLILGAVAGFVVLAAFGVPVLSYLPLLAIVAICPLMMLFMMKGMDHGGGSNRDDDSTDRTPSAHRH